MSHIFISHSSKDKEYVTRLEVELRKRGFSVWVDYQAIRSSEHWMDKLEQAVVNCQEMAHHAFWIDLAASVLVDKAGAKFFKPAGPLSSLGPAIHLRPF